MRYPEVLAWEYQWCRTVNDLHRLLYTTIKSIKPDAGVGRHVDHQQTSYAPFFRAAADYADMTECNDFIKLTLYHDIVGPRVACCGFARVRGDRHSEFEPGETVLDKIRTGRFDFVVLQVPTDCLAGRGDNDRGAFVAGLGAYVSAVRKAGGKPILYEQGWGDDELFDTGDKLLFDLAVKHDVAVAPCRSAWQRIRAERADIELHNLPDTTHPGTLGAYVNLCCFYSAISGKSPVGLPVQQSTYWPHLTDEEKQEARERLAGMTITDPYMKQLAGWMRTRSVASKTVPLDDALATHFQRVAWETWREYNKRVAEALQSTSR